MRRALSRPMGTISLFFLAILLLGLSGATAGEVACFREGRYLPIASHEVQGDFVRLNLGHRAWVVLPLSRLDRIERNREVVLRHPSAANERLVDAANEADRSMSAGSAVRTAWLSRTRH